MAQTTSITTDLVGRINGPGALMEPRSPEADGPDTDGRHLRHLRELLTGGAPEADLIDGVKRARAAGWSWTPIAIVLDSSRDQVIRRFSRGVGHPSTRRRRAHVPAAC
jgi:hypothetical protein